MAHAWIMKTVPLNGTLNGVFEARETDNKQPAGVLGQVELTTVLRATSTIPLQPTVRLVVYRMISDK